MGYLLPIFKLVSLTFAIAAVITGAQAITAPLRFSKSFGLPLAGSIKHDEAVSPKTTASLQQTRSVATSYISLMGARQLATGVILLIYAYQNKWTEMATILTVIGILVAGTDGVYLARAGAVGKAKLHAVPGALIAALAGAVIYSGA